MSTSGLIKINELIHKAQEKAYICESSGIYTKAIYKDITIIEMSLIQKWLRDTHSIYICASPIRWATNIIEVYGYTIRDFNNAGEFHCGNEYRSYEEAMEAGLIRGLELI